MEIKTTAIKGGEFLIKTATPDIIFTPEDYTEEQQMLRDAIRDFLNREIEPYIEEFDSKKGIEMTPKILERIRKPLVCNVVWV